MPHIMEWRNGITAVVEASKSDLRRLLRSVPPAGRWKPDTVPCEIIRVPSRSGPSREVFCQISYAARERRVHIRLPIDYRISREDIGREVILLRRERVDAQVWREAFQGRPPPLDFLSAEQYATMTIGETGEIHQ